MIRKTLLAGLLAAGLGGIAAPAAAAVDVYIDLAPPPARYEVVPAPRRGYVWTPGYWNWNGHRHVWTSGTWVRERPGYSYNHARWVEQDGRWRMERRGWARHDRDGDGVPDRYDRHPNNPRRD